MMSIKSAWLTLKSNALKFALVGVSGVALVACVGWYSNSVKLSIANKEISTLEALRQADKEAYTRAVAEATAKAIDEKAKREKIYDDAKHEAEVAYSSLRDKYDVAVLRYKQAVRGQGSGTDLPEDPGGSLDFVGVGENSLIPIPESDLYICAENTAKAITGHVWATKLKEAADKLNENAGHPEDYRK